MSFKSIIYGTLFIALCLTTCICYSQANRSFQRSNNNSNLIRNFNPRNMTIPRTVSPKESSVPVQSNNYYRGNTNSQSRMDAAKKMSESEKRQAEYNKCINGVNYNRAVEGPGEFSGATDAAGYSRCRIQKSTPTKQKPSPARSR
jgi:hypothetical protein